MPVTCNLWPLRVWTFSPVFKSQTLTRVSMPPDTTPPTGNSEFGGIHAKGPTKLVCPNRILELTNLRFPSRDHNLTVRSLDDVAMASLPQTHIPRTWIRPINANWNWNGKKAKRRCLSFGSLRILHEELNDKSYIIFVAPKLAAQLVVFEINVHFNVIEWERGVWRWLLTTQKNASFACFSSSTSFLFLFFFFFLFFRFLGYRVYFFESTAILRERLKKKVLFWSGYFEIKYNYLFK